VKPLEEMSLQQSLNEKQSLTLSGQVANVACKSTVYQASAGQSSRTLLIPFDSLQPEIIRRKENELKSKLAPRQLHLVTKSVQNDKDFIIKSNLAITTGGSYF
jgi:hypothetical protein